LRSQIGPDPCPFRDRLVRTSYNSETSGEGIARIYGIEASTFFMSSFASAEEVSTDSPPEEGEAYSNPESGALGARGKRANGAILPDASLGE